MKAAASPAVPAAVFSSRFAASPAAVWRQLRCSGFIARYLDAELPEATLEAGRALHGRDGLGRGLTLTVTEAIAPCSLAFAVDGAEGRTILRLALSACESGSRLTVLHELAEAPALRPHTAEDPVLALLAAPLPAMLQGGDIRDAAALAAAHRYLADSALAVQRLLAAMAAHEGYAKPAPDRFSLVEQLWHLADVEQFGWAQRLPRVLAEQLPSLPGVDGDRLALERHYQQRPWRAAARRFVAQRRRALAALDRFDSATLQRPVLFGGERIAAGALLAAMLAHDHGHRLEMAALWPRRGEPA